MKRKNLGLIFTISVLLLNSSLFQNCSKLATNPITNNSDSNSLSGVNNSPLSTASPSPSNSNSSIPTAPSQSITLAACEPSGKGLDYQVGTQPGQLASLADVPWDSLKAGDTVRIFYRSTPYTGKFLISANGSADMPIRICGVKNQAGLRPTIDGNNAVTRIGLDYGDSVDTSWLHQSRAIIQIKQRSSQGWTAFPTYIQIDGLEIRGANAYNTFTDTTGITRNYVEFGACIWVNRGQNITIADNIIHDCTQGIYTKSTDDGDFAVTKNIRIVGNNIYGNGVVGQEGKHNTYTASSNIIYENNIFGPLRVGATGNLIKDRSVGTVVRFNYLDGGAHSIDLVEAEDFPIYALANSAYRKTYVYGNIIIKNGDTGTAIHYGGDHYGSTPTSKWGEPFFRQGTLYFYNNSIRITGTSGVIFHLSTTLERAEVFNNILMFDPTVTYPSMRANTEINKTYWTAGGVVNLGKNWISAGWADSDPYHTVPGQLLGSENIISNSSAVIDPTSFIPIAGSSVIDAAATPSAEIATAIAAYPVNYQMNTSFSFVLRPVNGLRSDLGAIEK